MELLILGASARSAAFSALRLGLRPICADLFGDLDLTTNCPTNRIEPARYPDGLADFALSLGSMPWMYTGAIENRPDLVDEISSKHRLSGNPGPILRRVRDPLALATVVRSAGLHAPEVRREPDDLPFDGSWLIKPLASGGGRGIRPLTDPRAKTNPKVYYQERIPGRSLSALFVGDGAEAGCLGITRQFVGRAGHPFAYRGSLGPWPVSVPARKAIERLGQTIATHFGLIGLFGIDLIQDGDRVWLIEVNPRYTASVEVLEWALGRSLLKDHLKITGHPIEPDRGLIEARNFAGKAILFADRPFRWDGLARQGPISAMEFPEIADIPQPGTALGIGDPVLSVFAQGSSIEGCRKNLGRSLHRWRARIRSLDGLDLGIDQQEHDGGDQ